ncbi:MAG: hypothetical protein ACMXX9_03880 [Candidatus Woesearchaeota archaeon]
MAVFEFFPSIFGNLSLTPKFTYRNIYKKYGPSLMHSSSLQFISQVELEGEIT